MPDDTAPWFDAALRDLAPESAALVRAKMAGKSLDALGDPVAASRVFSEYLLGDDDIRYIRTLVGWDGWAAPRTWSAGDLANGSVLAAIGAGLVAWGGADGMNAVLTTVGLLALIVTPLPLLPIVWTLRGVHRNFDARPVEAKLDAVGRVMQCVTAFLLGAILLGGVYHVALTVATAASMSHAIRLHHLRRKSLRTRPYRNAPDGGESQSPAEPVSCSIP